MTKNEKTKELKRSANIASGELQLAVYSPESSLRSPLKMIQEMWSDLLASRELAWRLTVRDISARYRQSILGVLWAFLTPLATALIFVVLNRNEVINVGTTDIPYPVFVMFGTILWQLFVESINAPIKSVILNKPILAKINFPKEALVLSGIGQVLFDLGIKILILAAVMIFFQVPLTWGALLAPFAILLLMLLGIVLGLLLTPIGTLYSDITVALNTVTSLWFFVTPVIYPLPDSWPFSLLNVLNPVSPLLTGARDLAINGTLNDPTPFAVVSLLTILVLLFTWIIYRVSIPILVERMSA